MDNHFSIQTTSLHQLKLNIIILQARPHGKSQNSNIQIFQNMTKRPDIRAKQRAPGHARPSQWRYRPHCTPCITLAENWQCSERWETNGHHAAVGHGQRASRTVRTLRACVRDASAISARGTGHAFVDIPSLGSLTAMRLLLLLRA